MFHPTGRQNDAQRHSVHYPADAQNGRPFGIRRRVLLTHPPGTLEEKLYCSVTVALLCGLPIGGMGQVMEIGPAEAIYAPPYHPYTEALLSAVPIPDPAVKQAHIRLQGSVPSALNPPSGCPFHTRCPRRSLLPDNGAICAQAAPPGSRPATATASSATSRWRRCEGWSR